MFVDSLRRHVVGRPDERVRHRRLRAEEPAQAEVADLHHALSGDEHVGRLDVYKVQNSMTWHFPGNE